MATVGSLLVRVGANIAEYTNAMESMAKQANKAANACKKEFAQIQKYANNLASVGKSFTMGLTAPIMGFAAAAVYASNELAGMKKGLVALTGSTSEANKQFTALAAIARNSPNLGLKDVASAATNLQAAGFGAEFAQKAIKGFGNALALVGKGGDSLGAVVDSIKRISLKDGVSSKGLTGLIQAVPQVRAIMLRIYGTTDADAMKAAHVTSKTFLDTIVRELEKEPKIKPGFKKALENLKTDTMMAFGTMGDLIKPMALQMIQGLDSLAQKAIELSKAFAALSAPVQAGVGAVLALAAGIGPVMVLSGKLVTGFLAAKKALGSMAALFGTTSLAAVGWAAAIAVVVAGLVALGVWVYQHWEPIKTTLTQAWEGLSEMWLAAWTKVSGVLVSAWEGIKTYLGIVWSPIIALFSTVWDAIGPYFIKAWSFIADTLGNIWKGVKDTAVSLWDGIKEKFKSFINWLRENVPGAKKLLTLGSTWDTENAKHDKKQADANTPRISAPNAPAPPKVNGHLDEYRKYQAGLVTATSAAYAELLNPEQKETAKKLVEYYAKINDFKKQGVPISDTEIAKGAEQIKGAGLLTDLRERDNKKREAAKKKEEEILQTMWSQLDNLIEQDQERAKIRAEIVKAAEEAATAGSYELQRTQLDQWKELQLGSIESVNATTVKQKIDLEQKKLKIELDYLKKSEALELAKLERSKAAALAALEENKAKGGISPVNYDVQVKAVKDAYGQMSNDITKADEGTAAILKQQSENAQTAITRNANTLSAEISTVLTNMNQGIADAIVNFKGFGSLAISVIKQIGAAILASEIGKLLSPARMKTVADGIAGIFTKSAAKGLEAATDVASTAANTAAKTASAAADVGAKAVSTIGKSASTATKAVSSGLSSAMGMVTGAVSAVTGVISVLQNHAMNKSLDIIVKHTLQTANDLANLRRDEWDRHMGLLKKLDDIWNSVVSKLEMIIHGGIGGSVQSGSLAMAGSGGGVTIQITGGNWSTFGTVDDLVDSIIQTMRLRGILN